MSISTTIRCDAPGCAEEINALVQSAIDALSYVGHRWLRVQQAGAAGLYFCCGGCLAIWAKAEDPQCYLPALRVRYERFGHPRDQWP